MKNMKRWKRPLAVVICTAMMFSMSVGVSATENETWKKLLCRLKKWMNQL